jgi:polyamine oxidase
MLEMKPSRAIVLVLVVVVGQYASLASAAGPKVIIVGAGMSGKCLATTLQIAIDICGSSACTQRMQVLLLNVCFVGISAGKRMAEAGITDFVILEATDRIGGRIHKTKFARVNVEMGANWVEGVNGDEMNPIWTMANGTGGLNLRTFRSDFDNLARNTYKQECVQALNHNTVYVLNLFFITYIGYFFLS